MRSWGGGFSAACRNRRARLRHRPRSVHPIAEGVTHEHRRAAIVLTDLAFPESPRWHDGRLWVSDWGAGEVIAVGPDGHREVVARVESFPMCIDFLPDGRLLIVASSAGRVLRQEPDGSLVTHAELAGLSDHPWNDIVVDARGNAYVNNIGFDFPEGDFAPARSCS